MPQKTGKKYRKKKIKTANGERNKRWIEEMRVMKDNDVREGRD